MTIFFYRKPLVAGSAYKIESGGANYQHEFAKHWASCCLCWKIIIQFQKCLLKANHDSPSDSHFKYILDLTDKKLSNLARNVSVLRCLLTLICWTVVQIFFMILYQCLTERVFDFWYEVFHNILTMFPKNFSKFRFLWNYFIIFSKVNCLVFDWFFFCKARLYSFLKGFIMNYYYDIVVDIFCRYFEQFYTIISLFSIRALVFISFFFCLNSLRSRNRAMIALCMLLLTNGARLYLTCFFLRRPLRERENPIA